WFNVEPSSRVRGLHARVPASPPPSPSPPPGPPPGSARPAGGLLYRHRFPTERKACHALHHLHQVPRRPAGRAEPPGAAGSARGLPAPERLRGRAGGPAVVGGPAGRGPVQPVARGAEGGVVAGAD